MAVGIGRATKLLDSQEALYAVEWLMRRGWSNDPFSIGFMWTKSPMFDAYKEKGRVSKSTLSIEDFLPINVELTDGSIHMKSLSVSSTQQRFCVPSTCVERLREFCEQKRPDLIQKKPLTTSMGKKPKK
jgi:hypothetical protein